mmetsp:Transcript_19529/g.56966  ORF Transcript_19529/g.56966 Transcript_19529/m.56966 type:complete len:269 (+) Transcript_19529:1177-1983(+)
MKTTTMKNKGGGGVRVEARIRLQTGTTARARKLQLPQRQPAHLTWSSTLSGKTNDGIQMGAGVPLVAADVEAAVTARVGVAAVTEKPRRTLEPGAGVPPFPRRVGFRFHSSPALRHPARSVAPTQKTVSEGLGCLRSRGSSLSHLRGRNFSSSSSSSTAHHHFSPSRTSPLALPPTALGQRRPRTQSLSALAFQTAPGGGSAPHGSWSRLASLTWTAIWMMPTRLHRASTRMAGCTPLIGHTPTWAISRGTALNAWCAAAAGSDREKN